MKAEISQAVNELRQQLHNCPETGLKEHKTTAMIKKAMAPLGLIELDIGMDTGCAYRLKSGKNAPALCLRADIDAIDTEKGPAHACGHDHHAAGLYGAALLLAGRRGELPCDVVFLFQPAEELVTGAKTICENSFLKRENIGTVIGLHNVPELELGKISLSSGPVMAAKDSFEIVIKGKGGHGAMPEACADPIVAASAVVMALQTVVSRGIGALDSGVITVSSIHSGCTDNRIEDEAVMRGSVRSLQPMARLRIMERMEEIVHGLASGYGCSGELSFTGGVPAVINSAELYPAVKSAAEFVFGAENVLDGGARMISEDFSYYAGYVPAFFCFMGSGRAGQDNAPLHSDRYEAHPDTALCAANFLADLAVEYKFYLTK